MLSFSYDILIQHMNICLNKPYAWMNCSQQAFSCIFFVMYWTFLLQILLIWIFHLGIVDQGSEGTKVWIARMICDGLRNISYIGYNI